MLFSIHNLLLPPCGAARQSREHGARTRASSKFGRRVAAGTGFAGTELGGEAGHPSHVRLTGLAALGRGFSQGHCDKRFRLVSPRR